MKEQYDLAYLDRLGFTKPNIENISSPNLLIQTGMLDGYLITSLFIENNRNMLYNHNTGKECFEFYSHYSLTKGHCICTGMGFLLRENWILSKKEVSKVTVIEKNKDLIEYQKKTNPKIFNAIEVIHSDVYNYRGKCDTLLIDNFEGFDPDAFLMSTKKISENIDHSTLWFWPMEGVLSVYYKEYIGLNLSQIYNNIKKCFDLQTLPNLTEDELFDFCDKFWLGSMKKLQLL